MNKLFPVLAATAAIGVATLTARDALAGNVGSVIPIGVGFANVKSWVSVKMVAGQTLTFTPGPPQEPTILLIDDITYSVDVNPWQVGGAGQSSQLPCFNFNDLMGVLELQGNAFPSPYPLVMANPFLFFQLGFIAIPGGGFATWDVTTWAGAKGDWHALELNNQFLFPPPTPPFNQFFDRISHTTNGQLNGREVWFNMESEPRGTALGTSVSVSQSIVNTSESRHYQTPHICLPGTQVVAQTPANASPYTDIAVYIKGRVVTVALPLPITNGDVQVQ